MFKIFLYIFLSKTFTHTLHPLWPNYIPGDREMNELKFTSSEGASIQLTSFRSCGFWEKDLERFFSVKSQPQSQFHIPRDHTLCKLNNITWACFRTSYSSLVNCSFFREKKIFFWKILTVFPFYLYKSNLKMTRPFLWKKVWKPFPKECFAPSFIKIVWVVQKKKWKWEKGQS